MKSIFELSPLIESSLLGMLRGVCTYTLIYPLEVVKMHQQMQEGVKNPCRWR